jgi:hypothetical protein
MKILLKTIVWRSFVFLSEVGNIAFGIVAPQTDIH